jgi:hypothetical protein
MSGRAMRMSPEMRRNAGRFLMFLVGPYALFICSMALAASTHLALVLLMSAAFVFALPHMFFRGTAGVFIGVAINIAIAAAVTALSRKRTLTGAVGIYIACVAAAAVVLYAVMAAVGDPWDLFPRGGGI